MEPSPAGPVGDSLSGQGCGEDGAEQPTVRVESSESEGEVVTEPQGIADTDGRTDTSLEWCQDPSKGDVTEVWLTAVRQQTLREQRHSVAKFLPKGLYLSCSRGPSRLRKTEICFRVPGVDFLDFEHLDSTLRDVPSSSSFCHSCWQAEEPPDKSGSGASDTGDDTSSDSE